MNELRKNIIIIIPLAFETFGPVNSKVVSFFTQPGRRLADITGDMHETAFSFSACHQLYTAL